MFKTKRRLREAEAKIKELSERVDSLEKQKAEAPEPVKTPGVTAKQIINEWYYTEEERKANES